MGKQTKQEQINILKQALKRIAMHQIRADRRHREMVDIGELIDMKRTANLALEMVGE